MKVISDSPVGEIERELANEALSLERNVPLVIGVDEAGRGPWAGPVVAAAVILPAGFGVLQCHLPHQDELLRELNDSKKLTERRRKSLIKPICATALGVGVGISHPTLIDDINISQANYAAMTIAINKAIRAASKHPTGQLPLTPELITLIDGPHIIPYLNHTQRAIVKGDGRSYHIAAASVIAKIVRDKIMIAADRRYPGYGFAQHKGYGTKVHQTALNERGPCPIHRLSYRPVKEAQRAHQQD